MLSVTSLFNTSLMRRNFRRFWPIWAVYTIIWTVMMPVVMGLELTLASRNGSMVIGNNFSTMVLDYSAEIQVVFNACMGMLLAMALFSYLCSARSVGMMHSLPISRKSLFITNYVSGLAMLFSTYLITFLLTGIVESAFGILQLGELWQWLWVTCGTGFFCYSFGVLCAIFAGQVLAVPVFYVILNFVAIGMYYLLDSFASAFRFGSDGTTLEFDREVAWLSPLYRLMTDVHVRSEYIEETEESFQYLAGKSTVVIYIVVGAVLTAFAFVAYLRRKSESAGDVVAVTWAKPVFKYGVAFCMAFTVGLGMYHLFIKSFLPGYNNNIPGALACLVVAGVIGYYIAEMLLQKSFKVIRKGGKGALAAAIGILVIGLVMTLDLTGYDNYIPERGEVTGVRAYINGPDFHVDYNGTEADVIDDVYALHASIIANRDELMDRSADWAYGRRDDLNYCYVNVEYYCGSEENPYETIVERRYEVYCPDEELNTPGTVGFAIADFLYNETVFSHQFLNHTPSAVKQVLGGRFSYLSAENDYTWYETELTEAQANALYDALLTDIAAITYERADSFSELGSETFSRKECDLTFYLLDVNGRSFDVYVNLGAHAKKTIEALYTAEVLEAGEELVQWSDESGSYEVITHEVTVAG